MLLLRSSIAFAIAISLAVHGLKKKSLNLSGCVAAFTVGFCSFAASYRFGLILILFYLSSSKLTKLKEDVKETLEEDYQRGGQRNWIQVLANSFLATLIAVMYFGALGEDKWIKFSALPSGEHVEFMGMKFHAEVMRAYLWSFYVAHYACATADTWASEIGILSRGNPRLVTSFFLKEVPRGTNGGMSVLGTAASGAGGLFIGLIFWLLSLLMHGEVGTPKQYPMVLFGMLCGLLGSLYDSILGATLQASYFSKDRKCIVKSGHSVKDPSVVKVCGVNLLSNEAVNFVSILMTMVTAAWLAPSVFCSLDPLHC